MAITNAPATFTLEVPLDQIRVPENVRPLDPAHVDALAGSIALQGLIVPVVVRPDTDGKMVLVAGFHRLAAHRQLGLNQIIAVVRDHETEEADRAVENVVRTALRADEEARAVQAMLDRGLTVDGAAQALGWPRQRVTARLKLLELPERARELIGSGTIALSAVDQLRSIGQVSPPLLDAVIGFVAEGNGWAAERLSREPGWVIDSALRSGDAKVFCAHLTRVDPHQLPTLRLGKKTDELVDKATALHKQLDRYSYGAPEFRFSPEDIDQARASATLIEFETGAPLITDRSIYRELCKQAIARTVGDLEEKVARRDAERKAQRKLAAAGSVPDDPVAAARREEQAEMRELAEQAHGVNLDLGWALMNNLAAVDPSDMMVARLFTYGLLGADWDGSGYTHTGDRIARIAASGIRLVIDEFRADVTKTKKDGTRGRLRIDYGDSREPEQPIKWIWRFLDGATDASSLYGRALVVIAAEQYASRLVVPQSQRTHQVAWNSHKDIAAKALKKLVGPHLPASLRQLEAAVRRAHEKLEKTEQTARSRAAARGSRHGSNIEADPAAVGEPDDAQPTHDLDVDVELGVNEEVEL
jgi:ParB/RepB/Spo0J family partition protein